jgi:hypothetical protein
VINQPGQEHDPNQARDFWISLTPYFSSQSLATSLHQIQPRPLTNTTAMPPFLLSSGNASDTISSSTTSKGGRDSPIPIGPPLPILRPLPLLQHYIDRWQAEDKRDEVCSFYAHPSHFTKSITQFIWIHDMT